jgi:hypothetical protein
MSWISPFVHHSRGGTRKRLPRGSSIILVEWTPDGKHIVLSADRRDNWEIKISDTEVFELEITASGLTNRRGEDGSPPLPDKTYRLHRFDEKYQAIMSRSFM